MIDIDNMDFGIIKREEEFMVVDDDDDDSDDEEDNSESDSINKEIVSDIELDIIDERKYNIKSKNEKLLNNLTIRETKNKEKL